MKTTLIFLTSLAGILIIFAYFAVFGPPTGSYQVNGAGTTSGIPSNPWIVSSSIMAMSGTPEGSSPASGGGGSFASTFPTSPLTWPEGQSKISITGVSLQGSQMAFTLSVLTGGALECVPLNLRLVADEAGDLDPPTPASLSFPDSGNCNGAPGKIYANLTATFTVDPTALPLLFTTGGSSNIFFEIATTTANGLEVDFPGTSG